MKLNKNDVIEYYKNHTKKQTANHFGISVTTVFNYMEKSFYKCRAFQCPQQLTIIQKDLITGSMLGDGSLSKLYPKKAKSLFAERHCERQLPYLEWKAEILKPFAPKIRPEFITTFGKKRLSYKLETVRHQIFANMEKKWYKRDCSGQLVIRNGKRIKCLPNDLQLNPFIIAVWFFDDGRNAPTRKSLYLSTDGFTLNECELLSSWLDKFSIHSHPVKTKTRRHEIYIESRSYIDFIDMVKDYIPCEVLAYKIIKGKRRYGHA